MNTTAWISIENANKIIKGKKVLSNINVIFEKGKIYGIVGDNGSGKTMMLRAIAKLLHLSSGTVVYAEKNATMGLIIENPGFLLDFSGFENLEFLARIRNQIDADCINLIMKDVGLDPDDDRKVKSYSLGMKQKLAIAQAIMENPDMLVLDEPFRGLDSKSMKQIEELLLKYNRCGGTIFLSSHDYEAISRIADKIYRMENGVISEFMPDRRNK